MSQEDQVAELNDLLRRFFQLEEEQAAHAANAREEMERLRQEGEQRRKETMREMLRKGGLPEEATDPDENFEQRLKDAQAKALKNAEELRARAEKYQAELLQELRIQTDLLKRIAEKVGLD